MVHRKALEESNWKKFQRKKREDSIDDMLEWFLENKSKLERLLDDEK